MEYLFPRMMDSLNCAVSKMEIEMVKLFASQRKALTEEEWTEYGDNLETLQYRLKQLNTVLHFEFEFEEDFAKDVIHYSKLLNENRESCEELVGYLLSRGDEPWVGERTSFLKEVLEGIIGHCDRITRFFN